MTTISPSAIPMDDPRYPIFGRLFMCRIPRLAHYGGDYIKTYGLPTSGYKDIDLGLITKPQLCYITINQMVEFYHDNQIVAIVKQNDVKTVYEICQDYTFEWANRIKNSLYSNTAPLEDLLKIDEFAEAVYQYAGHQYGVEYAKTFVEDFGGVSVGSEIDNIQQMLSAIDNAGNNKKEKEDEYTVRTQFSKKTVEVIEAIKPKEIELPDRPTVRDLFMSYMKN